MKGTQDYGPLEYRGKFDLGDFVYIPSDADLIFLAPFLGMWGQIVKYNWAVGEYEVKLLYPRAWLNTNFYTGWFESRYLIKYEPTQEQMIEWIAYTIEG